MKELDPVGGACTGGTPLDPPMMRMDLNLITILAQLLAIDAIKNRKNFPLVDA